MKITEIAFSCYPVTDMAKSRAFYEGILGLTLTMDTGASDDGHWVEYDIGAGTLAIGSAPGWKSSPDGCSVGLEVEDFDQAVATIKAADVPIKMGPLETPVCHMLMVQDPDGNVVIIHKRKPGHH
jgi:catechol 2,3-dioxygenase-like lactoylglutathione lyase family enzyme